MVMSGEGSYLLEKHTEIFAGQSLWNGMVPGICFKILQENMGIEEIRMIEYW